MTILDNSEAHAFSIMKKSLEEQFQVELSDWDCFIELFSLKKLDANEDWLNVLTC